MDAVYPEAASALARGRRRRRAAPRLRHRTAPVTFAEIKEVDEEKEDCEEASRASTASVVSAAEERRRRPDVLGERLELLDERLDREFAAFRRRRARRQPLREPDELSAEQLAEQPTEQPVEQPVEQPAERPAEQPDSPPEGERAASEPRAGRDAPA